MCGGGGGSGWQYVFNYLFLIEGSRLSIGTMSCYHIPVTLYIYIFSFFRSPPLFFSNCCICDKPNKLNRGGGRGTTQQVLYRGLHSESQLLTFSNCTILGQNVTPLKKPTFINMSGLSKSGTRR